MIEWSFTGSKVFDKCQRQWFYRNVVASAHAKKDPARREAYLLSKLKSVHSWRGNLVDEVISKEIVPLLERGGFPSTTVIIKTARELFDKQAAFAINHRMREPGFCKADDSFAAFFAVEYGVSVSESDLKTAWEEVEQALLNLLRMRELLDDLRRARRLIAQRTLNFSVFDVKAEARPDLFAIYLQQPPLIVDWKVHTFGTTDYRLQLATYALALERITPHRDFAEYWRSWPATEMRLLEVQLLTDSVRPYRLSEEDIDELEDTIVESYARIQLALADGIVEARDPFALPPTDYAKTCETCNFRAPCWEEMRCELKQMTLL
jgi:hypothetical protein